MASLTGHRAAYYPTTWTLTTLHHVHTYMGSMCTRPRCVLIHSAFPSPHLTNDGESEVHPRTDGHTAGTVITVRGRTATVPQGYIEYTYMHVPSEEKWCDALSTAWSKWGWREETCVISSKLRNLLRRRRRRRRRQQWRVACCVMEINSFQSTAEHSPCLLVVVARIILLYTRRLLR